MDHVSVIHSTDCSINTAVISSGATGPQHRLEISVQPRCGGDVLEQCLLRIHITYGIAASLLHFISFSRSILSSFFSQPLFPLWDHREGYVENVYLKTEKLLIRNKVFGDFEVLSISHCSFLELVGWLSFITMCQVVFFPLKSDFCCLF